MDDNVCKLHIGPQASKLLLLLLFVFFCIQCSYGLMLVELCFGRRLNKRRIGFHNRQQFEKLFHFPRAPFSFMASYEICPASLTEFFMSCMQEIRLQVIWQQHTWLSLLMGWHVILVKGQMGQHESFFFWALKSLKRFTKMKKSLKFRAVKSSLLWTWAWLFYWGWKNRICTLHSGFSSEKNEIVPWKSGIMT